jgi:hypothetical protein
VIRTPSAPSSDPFGDEHRCDHLRFAMFSGSGGFQAPAVDGSRCHPPILDCASANVRASALWPHELTVDVVWLVCTCEGAEMAERKSEYRAEEATLSLLIPQLTFTAQHGD